jgi:hypothetical protein
MTVEPRGENEGKIMNIIPEHIHRKTLKMWNVLNLVKSIRGPKRVKIGRNCYKTRVMVS